MQEYEKAYIAALIDARGHVGTLFDSRTGHRNPYLRIVWKRQPLLQIAKRMPIFNGPYDLNARWSYLTVRRTQLLYEVLEQVQPYMIVQADTVQKILPFVRYRASHLYYRNIEMERLLL